MKTIAEGSRVWWIYRHHGSATALTAAAQVVALHGSRIAWIKVFMPATGIEFRRVWQGGLRIRTTTVPALDDHV